MKIKMKSIFGVMLSLVLVLGGIPGTNLRTYAAEVNVTQSTYEWTNGNTYIVDGDVSILYNRIKVTGEVTLKLKSGTLTAEKGIEVNEDNKLTIEGDGTLVAKGTNSFANANAAIGGGSNYACGTIVINSGNITADSEAGAAAIGGGSNGSGGNITINNGTVTAKTGANAAGIGGGKDGDGGDIVINGGTINASSEQNGAGIGGGGSKGLGGNITINGGNVKAEATDAGYPGIGAYADWGTITITGGTVEAQAGSYTAGIGGGYNGKGGSITITGGNVTANGKGGGAGIGAGRYCKEEGTISITGGNVTAASNRNVAEGIGKADDSASVTFKIGKGIKVYSSESEITDVATIPTENITTGPVDNVTARAMYMKTIKLDYAEVTTVPAAKTLTFTGYEQELVSEGVANNGDMRYALTEDAETEPSNDSYGKDIPKGKNAGTYYVWYKAAATSDGYVDSDADKVAVTIEKKSIEKATVTLDNSSITYTGEELKVAVDKVTIGENELTEDDYEVSGTTAATEVGMYKVTVTGKGNYEGIATTEWKITSTDDIFTDVQKPSAKSSLKYTGSALELVNAPTEKLPEGYKMSYALGENETNVPASDDWSEYIPTETNAGTYYVWYKITDSAGNDALTTCIPVTIAKATPFYDVPTGLTAVKGQTLADVDLPDADNGTWKWADAETTSVGEVGENKFKVIFVPDDTANYEEVKNVEVVIKVTDTKKPENPDNPETPETPDNPDTPDKPDSEDKTDKDKNADIAIGDEDKKKTGITDIISKDLDDYAKNQAGNNVQVTMKVTAKDVDSVDSETANFILEMVGETYEGMDADEVKNEYLDISITKSVDGGSEEEVKDLGRVIEIAVSYDLEGKHNPVILREHNGEVVKFRRLNSRATNNKEDATFYVDEENEIIYVYSQFFSTYSIAYTTVPSYQITIDDGNGNVDQIVVANGATITEPKAPTKEGYKFLGWYVGDDKYDFTKPVTEKLTLTAKWEKIITPEINLLVTRQKVFGSNYFEKYGEDLSKYKYKFKVDDKSQKKILGATKDMIKAKNAGTAKAALYRKTRKGGSWEKIEEVEFVVEKPEVTKKVTTLKPGDTAEALSFVTSKMSVKPTYYLSSKPEVAEVDFETGKIKVLKKGSTTITIAYDNGIGAAKYKTKLVIK